MAQDRLRKSGPFRHLPASHCNLPGGSVLAAILAHFLTAINTAFSVFQCKPITAHADGYRYGKQDGPCNQITQMQLPEA